MIKIVIGLFSISLQLSFCTAQLPDTESLRNVTHCDFGTTLDLTCGTNEVIAIHSIQHAYNVLCETTCCDTYTSTDCFENGDTTDITTLRRLCSGQTTCSVPTLKTTTDFCALGVKSVSYVFLQYYCIPNDRTSSICASSQTLTSNGEPLYITNENYPGVTTGSASCSCSLEAYSCSSSINVYIIDADLYYDASQCEQNLVFKDGTDGALKTIACDSYYTNNIAVSTISSHYSKIDFINNSTADQEGYFFIGLEASGTDITFSLSCSAQTETWCVDCGSLPTIAFGSLVLDVAGNTGYQDTATVNCDSGYETSSLKVTCYENATWESALCSAKDCGSLPTITSGSLVLDVAGKTDYQATATVNCDSGYETESSTVTCLPNATWESALCSLKDCGSLPIIAFGSIVLDVAGSTGYQATATVNCDSGYETDSQNVTCLENAHWESAVCSLIGTNTTDEDDGDDQNKPDENEEKNGGLASWMIVVITVSVIGFIAIIIFISVIGYKKCNKRSSEAVNPAGEDMEEHNFNGI